MAEKSNSAGFETLYTAGVTFGEEVIKRTARMRFDVYHWKDRLVLFIVSVLCIVAGFFFIKVKGLAICMIALGCIMLTSGNTKPNSVARQAIKELNGRTPSLNYFFGESGYKYTGAMDKEGLYSDVNRLVEDEKYLYVFLEREAAHVLEKDSARRTGDETLKLDELKAFLEEKTGLTWTKPLTGKRITIWNLIANLKEKEKRSRLESWEAERLPYNHRK